MSGNSVEGLTDSEVMGNMFIYTLAGYETTASALSYCTLLLAVYPKWQDWVADEVQTVRQGHESIEEWDYETLFPRLKRNVALMLETLRLFLPDRHRAQRRRRPHTPKHWGGDSLLWRPSRWITSPEAGAALETVLDAETVREPTKGSYLPWSEGARICPGRKLVAAMAVLLRGHRVRIVTEEGESLDEARSRALGSMEKRKLDVVVQKEDCESVSVAWASVESLRGGGNE